MTVLRVGVIGAGVMGRGHAEFIRDNISEAKVVAVSDVDIKRATGLAAGRRCALLPARAQRMGGRRGRADHAD